MTNETIAIDIARDFNPAPAGRYKTDGDYSGQRFREQFLKPYLLENKSIEIDVSNLIGAGSSFLEEAFGGLIREDNLPLDTIKCLLEIVPNDDDYAIEIWDYINKEASIKKR